LRKPSGRERLLLGLLAIVVLFVGGRWLSGGGGTSPQSGGRAARPEGPVGPLPRIDLARLEKPHSSEEAGRRDLFDASSALREQEPVEPVVVETPRPQPPGGGVPGGAGEPGATEAAAQPTLPPLNLSYIGSVENARGVKVAVLLTEKREVLTGQPGQVVANRYRIARIGLESVDLEDVSSGQSRRLPLRGKP
jgi:hypothetical protein